MLSKSDELIAHTSRLEQMMTQGEWILRSRSEQQKLSKKEKLPRH